MNYIVKADKFFDYNQLAGSKWRELIHEAKKNFNVYFDLENDNPTKQEREIIIPQKEWKLSKCKFKCAMFAAGGDWEWPVRYFRCQLVDGYAFGIQKYGENNGMFIYIPGKTEGNYHLVKFKDKWGAPDNYTYKKGIDPEPNERKCWEALKNYLKMLVDKEIEKVRSERQEIPTAGEEIQVEKQPKIEKARTPGAKDIKPRIRKFRTAKEDLAFLTYNIKKIKQATEGIKEISEKPLEKAVAQVKGFSRVKRGKVEIVKPFERKLLTPEQEQRLAKEYLIGKNPYAKQELMRKNQGFVYQTAFNWLKRYGNLPNADLQDLAQEGMLGLSHAIDKFELGRGRLITYAKPWIEAYIRKYLKEKFVESKKEITEWTEGGEGEEVSVFETIESEMLTPEEETISEQSKRILREVIKRVLSPKEQEVIESRYLTDDPMTLEEVGQKMGFTKMRIKQIEDEALKKLRTSGKIEKARVKGAKDILPRKRKGESHQIYEKTQRMLDQAIIDARAKLFPKEATIFQIGKDYGVSKEKAEKIYKEKFEKSFVVMEKAIKHFAGDIENLTKENKNFRKVLFTGKHSQLVVMSILPGQEVGVEKHKVDQFFRVEGGKACLWLNEKKVGVFGDGDSFIVPAGTWHNVVNRGDTDLKLYTIYSPPEHPAGTIESKKDETIKKAFVIVLEKAEVKPFTRTRHGKLEQVKGWFKPSTSYETTTTGIMNFIKNHLGLDNYHVIVANEAKTATYRDEATANTFLEITDKSKNTLHQWVQSDPEGLKKFMVALYDQIKDDVGAVRGDLRKSNLHKDILR